MATIVSRCKEEYPEWEENLYIDEGAFCGMTKHPGWTIRLNVKGHWTNNKCKHCVLLEEKDEDGDDVWMIPRIAVVGNEGGHNSTGLCLDCALDVIPGEKLEAQDKIDKDSANYKAGYKAGHNYGMGALRYAMEVLGSRGSIG